VRTSKKAADEVLAVWYKPHYQCGAEAGSTPDEAAAFVNAQLSYPDDEDMPTRDFVGVSEWAPTTPVIPPLGNNPAHPTNPYGSVAAICGYGSDQYKTPVVLFHDRRRWDVVERYPPSQLCVDRVFLPPWDQGGLDCADRTAPTDVTSTGDTNPDNCCSCTYSAEEYKVGNDWGQNLGQRPWVAGIYRRKADGREVCVVAGEFPHPLANVTLWDLNGQPTWSSSGGQEEPYTIMPYVCTTQYSPSVCVPNLEGTSVVFGTDVFVRTVKDFCGDERDIIIMADTNVGMGDFPSSKMFTDPFYSALVDNNTQEHGTQAEDLQPYTCCNDTSYDGGMNRYASDRIMVLSGNGKNDNNGSSSSSSSIKVNDLEGGSVAPGGSLPDDLPYVCHASQEHAPVRAYISLPALEKEE